MCEAIYRINWRAWCSGTSGRVAHKSNCQMKSSIALDVQGFETVSEPSKRIKHLQEFAHMVVTCPLRGHDWIRGELEDPPVGFPNVMHRCSSCGHYWVGAWEDGCEDGENPPGYHD